MRSTVVELNTASTDRIERPREPSRRLFFALWPDPVQQVAFAHAARKAVKASGGRPVAMKNIHLTLVFLGSVAETKILAVTSIARHVAAAFPQGATPLAFEFERLEHWKKARVLCAVPSVETLMTTADVPLPAAGVLADALRAELVSGGFAPDLKAFRPHVTLARSVVHPTDSDPMSAALWSFGAFALVQSQTASRGAVYSVLDSFPLGRH